MGNRTEHDRKGNGKARGAAEKLPACLLVTGMAVQIALGIAWMSGNIFSLQQFSVTEGYVRASGGAADEFQGVLYVFLVAVFRGIASACGVPFYVGLYAVQVAAAVCAGCFFLGGSGICGEKPFGPGPVFGSLFLLTAPFLMQAHLAVMPQSLCLSAVFVSLGLVFETARGKRRAGAALFAALGLLWLAGALLNPDYVWLGAIPAVFCLVISIRRKQGFLKQAGVLLAVFCVFAAAERFTVREDGEKIQRSLGAAMVSRFVWPNFETDYFFWPEEIKAVMTKEQAASISRRPEDVRFVFGPAVERAYGRKKADELYWRMAWNCLNVRTKEKLGDVAADFGAYVCPPLSAIAQFRGGGRSFAGWNYERMSGKTPSLTALYVRYGLYAFAAGLLCAAVSGLLSLRGRTKKTAPPGGRAALTAALLCGLFQAVWHTMASAGRVDYLNVPLCTALWYAALLPAIQTVTVSRVPDTD